MKSSELDKRIYKRSLSASDSELLSTLSSDGMQVFSPLHVSEVLGSSKASAYNRLSSLNRKGWVRRVGHGLYLLCDLSGTPTQDPLQVASKVVWPSYISFWSALNFYRLTEQAPKTIFLVTTRQRRPFQYGGRLFRFVRFSSGRFFGYTKLNGVVIADMEKALIDSLYLPRYAGGIGEVARCFLEAKDKASVSRLVEYALKMGNSSLALRLGYLFDLFGFSVSEPDRQLLLKHKSSSYPVLDQAAPRKGFVDKNWALLVNRELEC